MCVCVCVEGSAEHLQIVVHIGHVGAMLQRCFVGVFSGQRPTVGIQHVRQVAPGCTHTHAHTQGRIAACSPWRVLVSVCRSPCMSGYVPVCHPRERNRAPRVHTQAASRPVHPFLQDTRSTDQQTHRQTHTHTHTHTRLTALCPGLPG